MTHQPSFAHAEFAAKKKVTRREKFLARMEEVIPWTQLLTVIEPFYPKGKRGRPPIGLERMLRVYFLQQWYALADEALEDALYDSHALQSFARIELAAEGVPDATTLLNFRHLLERHDLCKSLFTATRRTFQPPFTPGLQIQQFFRESIRVAVQDDLVDGSGGQFTGQPDRSADGLQLGFPDEIAEGGVTHRRHRITQNRPLLADLRRIKVAAL